MLAPHVSPTPSSNSSWSIYRRLLRYAKPYTGVFMIGVLGMVLFAATNAVLGLVVKEFMNGAFVQKNPAILWEMPLAVVVLFTLRGIGDFVGNYYPSWVGRQVVKSLRRDVFAHYLRLPSAYLRD
jgi:subfamily B ATP-binding cassette protein MsbA